MLVQQGPKLIFNLQPFSPSKVPVLLLSFAKLDLCKALCKMMFKFYNQDM